MKLTTNIRSQSPRCSSHKRGFTLIEITMVIALLILLIGILTLSMRAYKDGADRAGCLLTQSNVQKAVRSEAALRNLSEGDPLAVSTLQGPRKYFDVVPTGCPARGTYTFLGTVPAPGVPYVRCSLGTGYDPAHIDANDYRGW